MAPSGIGGPAPTSIRKSRQFGQIPNGMQRNRSGRVVPLTCQEELMRKSAFWGVAALALMTSGYAVAQEPNAAQAQQQNFPAQPQMPGTTTAPDHTVPPPPH